MAEASRLYRAALSRFRKSRPAGHRDIETTAFNLALSLRNISAYNDAEPLLREVLGLRKARASGQPLEIADMLDTLGAVVTENGRPEEALTLHQEAITIRQVQSGASNSADAGISLSWNGSAMALQALGRYSEAATLYRNSIARLITVRGVDHPYTQTTQQNLVGLLFQIAQTGEALSLTQQVLEAMRRRVSATDPTLANSLMAAGLLKAEAGDLDGGVKDLEEALAIWRQFAGVESTIVAHTLGLLSGRLISGGRVEQAGPYAAEALAIARKKESETSPRLARALMATATVLAHQNRLPEALLDTEEALGIEVRLRPGYASAKMLARYGRGHYLMRLERPNSAYDEFRVAGQELLNGPGRVSGVDLEAKRELDSWRNVFVLQFQTGWASAHMVP